MNFAIIRVLAALAALATAASSVPVQFKERCLKDLVSQVPKTLAAQDRQTGRFGKGIWIVTDQNRMLPLAAAWSYRNGRNPYYHDRRILDAIMSAGDALIDDQDAKGRWEFRKKDGSTWGKIYMPWTYSRWIRTFLLVREAMPDDRRARWQKALLLGYSGIAREVAGAPVHNIAAHHAMGLYFAGVAFEKPEWRDQATRFMHQVVKAQHSDGYWSEHVGPVVNYGFVYVEALGTYLAASKDESIRATLRKSALFHSHFTYPDGSPVETVDERNPYHFSVSVPNVGFSLTPEGRSYMARLLALRKAAIPADEAASLLLWGEEGEGALSDPATADFDYALPSGDAAVRRRGPWFLAVSALTAPVSGSRWIQDRQNFVSVFHYQAGLIIGGGNTKLQPLWSNFTIGDVALLRHKPGDENPRFQPPSGLTHVPSAARLLRDGDFGVELDYGAHHGRIILKILGPDRLEYTCRGDASMAAHITVLPHLDDALKSAAGESATLGAAALAWRPGAWIDHAAFRLLLPAGTTLRWPVLPHDPYRKDGHAESAQARLVLNPPPSGDQTIVIEIRRQ